MLMGLAQPLILTAESLGVPPPNCGGGSAYIDSSTNDWACTAPPVTQQQGGVGMLIFAVITAAVVFWYLGRPTAKTIEHVSKGQVGELLPDLTGMLEGK
jgi:hypothetical protein